MPKGSKDKKCQQFVSALSFAICSLDPTDGSP